MRSGGQRRGDEHAARTPVSAVRAGAMNPADAAMDAAARLLAATPGAAHQALARHRRRPDGRCTGCTTRLTWWPCALASIARRAAEMEPPR
jgi:hypothetical protein